MGSLRVIGGKARGKRLSSVPGDTTRPITDRTKESLFNIIGADIQAARFLDLFGGTGSVGIEALSRGASYIRFLDIAPQAVKTIRENLNSTGLAKSDADSRAEVLRMDAFTFLARDPDIRFDYVYIAPPQYKELWKRALLSLDDHPGWLNTDAWMIVQIHPKEYEPLMMQNIEEFEQRKYGSTILVFYQLKEA